MKEVKERRGPHPDKALSAVRLKTLTTPGRYADGNGLYLIVAPGGSRSWMLRTVVRGRRCDIGLGSLRLTSLGEAREAAVQYRKVARAGGDPMADRRQSQRVVPTFAEAARQVHAAHGPTFRNEKHRAQWLASLELNVFPILGDRRVDHIESGDVLKALSPIWLAKPETARRIRQRIRVVLDWAKASGFRSGDNPVDGVKQALPEHRGLAAHHAALPYTQVSAFVRELRKSDATEATRLAFEFLILTAARTSEVVGARWDEIDLKAKTWTVPATRIKAGREHRVPLSARAVEILQKAQGIMDGGPFVFPGRSPEHPLSNMVFLMLLRRLQRNDVTAHGFRSSFRDWAAERTNAPQAVCEAALAHSLRDKTEAAYNRTDLFERRRELMTAWERFATAKRADVVAIHS